MITYTLPVDAKHRLAGQTLTNGQVGMYKGEKLVYFAQGCGISTIYIKVKGKKGLELQVEAFEEQERRDKVKLEEQERRDKAKLEINVPGLETLIDAYNYEIRYQEEFNRMMAEENKVPYSDLAKQYPRAHIYMRAEAFSGAEDYRKSAAGCKAMAIIAGGGELEEAKKVMDNWFSGVDID